MKNPDRVKESKHHYYETHKEQIREYRKQYRLLNQIECERCGLNIYKYKLGQHQQTQTCKAIFYNVP